MAGGVSGVTAHFSLRYWQCVTGDTAELPGPPLLSCQDRLHSGDSDQTDQIKFGFYPFKSYVVVCENQQPDLDMVEGNVQGRVHEL